ncbi:hypothetical protein Tco_0092986 [Tanacetum coccineum]
MAGLDFCSKHNMVAYLEKNDGNTEFHHIMDFLTNNSINFALTLRDVPVPMDYFPVPALTKKVLTFMVKKGKNFSGNVTPLFNSMFVQPTEDEGEPDPSPRPSSPNPIPDSNLEGFGGNHRGQSSSDNGTRVQYYQK